MKIDPTLGHKTCFNKFWKTGIIFNSRLFSDITNLSSPMCQKFNSPPQQVNLGEKEQVKMTIRIFLELNETKMHIQPVLFSSVTQSCPTLCDPMNSSPPGLPVHHQLPEFSQTHVHRGGDSIQPSHPLLPPSPPALNLSQHQGLFQSQFFT